MSYAQFLLRHYFPEMQRLCQGEGMAMRAYAMGMAGKELIGLQAEQSAAHRARYIGCESAPEVSTEALAFEARWRAVHLSGPITKGSRLDPPETRQI